MTEQMPIEDENSMEIPPAPEAPSNETVSPSTDESRIEEEPSSITASIPPTSVPQEMPLAVDETSSITPRPEKKGLSKPVKIIIGIVIGIIVIIGALAAAFVMKANAYEEAFLPNTYVQGVNVEGMTVDEAYQVLTSQMKSLEITVDDPESSASVLSGPDINLHLDQAVLDDILANQSKWDWLKSTFTDASHNDIGILYDVDAITAFVNKLPCVISEDRLDPVNATVEYDERAGEFKGVGAKDGNRADAQKLQELIVAAVSDGGGRIDASETFGKPQWTEDSPEILDAIDKLNGYIEKKISYNIDMINEAETLTKDQIASFLAVDSSNPESIEVAFKDEMITAWLRELGQKYDTAGTERTFTNVLGKQVTVSGGTFGWLTDESAMLPIVKENILSDDKTINQDFVYERTALAPKGQLEWGNTYAEVDLSEQHAMYIKNGEIIWESDCVTGVPIPAKETTPGVWTILEKQRNKTLVGEIDPRTGKPEYETPVATWMRITWSGIGFHSAPWQSAFGGSRYRNGYGSHGCVNLPTYASEQLYQVIEMGDPVIIHY